MGTSCSCVVSEENTRFAEGRSRMHSYLLSGQVSLIGGIRAPSVRIVLLGSPSPQNKADFYRDPDSIIFSEILEFALSLVVPTKGQEVFSGLPHLQPYKLLRAWSLAEAGQVKLASRYVLLLD
jgi:COPII coat assembly protein SEC16